MVRRFATCLQFFGGYLWLFLGGDLLLVCSFWGVSLAVFGKEICY